MTNEEHNKYLGISFLVHGGIQLVFMLLIAAFFAFFISVVPDNPGRGDEPPVAFFIVFGVVMFVFQLVFTAPAFIAAYGLLKRKSWARIASMVGAVMAGMSFPIGTAVCVYALWFMVGEGWKEVYPQAAAPARGALPHHGEYIPWEEQARRAAREKAPPPPPPDWR